MLRWLCYLLISLPMELLAILLAPVLPLFARPRYGPIDNGNAYGVEPRLPRWLDWFATPDNSLLGDEGHKARWRGRSQYLQMVAWLLRNRLYGFRWSVLAAPLERSAIHWSGNLNIRNRQHGVAGLLRVRMGGYWQYKRITPLWLGRCLQLNLGWIIDPFIKDPGKTGKAIYSTSVRLTAFFPDPS